MPLPSKKIVSAFRSNKDCTPTHEDDFRSVNQIRKEWVPYFSHTARLIGGGASPIGDEEESQEPACVQCKDT